MNKRYLTLKEHQDILYEILYTFDDFCKENDIHYFLAYGTLLGAVRHNGIIPWDDDVDVMMKRQEYERFEKLIINNPPRGYRAYSINNTPHYYYPFIKFGKLGTRLIEKDWKCVPKEGISINIDVFPIDGSPNVREEAERYVVDEVNRYFYKIRYWFNRTWKDFGGKKQKLIFPIYMLCKRQMFLKRYFKKLFSGPTKYDLNGSKYFFIYWPYQDTRGLLSKDLLNSSVLLTFGSRKLPVPTGYDTILHSLYGDYMTPLPENARSSTHKNEVFVEE